MLSKKIENEEEVAYLILKAPYIDSTDLGIVVKLTTILRGGSSIGIYAKHRSEVTRCCFMYLVAQQIFIGECHGWLLYPIRSSVTIWEVRWGIYLGINRAATMRLLDKFYAGLDRSTRRSR